MPAKKDGYPSRDLNAPELKTASVMFPAGKVIYPYGPNAAWTIVGGNLLAQETTRKKSGLKVYIATTSVAIYHNNRHLTLTEGKEFIAYSKAAKKIKSDSAIR